MKRALLSGLLKDGGISEGEYAAAYKNKLEQYRKQQAKKAKK